ncbi:hypothetical protein [Streptomyces sp. NPDC056975]|uniref:hypothetical protein n=1 Tax=unclassified Streptomyces TaxID=2593676 RepID=UPI003640249C
MCFQDRQALGCGFRQPSGGVDENVHLAELGSKSPDLLGRGGIADNTACPYRPDQGVISRRASAFVGRFAPVAVRSPGSARFDVGDLDRLGELGVDPLLPSARPSSLVLVRDGFS